MEETEDHGQTRGEYSSSQSHAAMVLWRYCDGETSPELVSVMLARELGDCTSNDFVWRALEQAQDALQLARAVARP